MNKRFIMRSVLACVLGMGVLATACGKKESGKKHDIEIKVWAAEAVKDLTQKQANAWADQAKQQDGVDIGVTVQAVGEGDAASNMITDVQAGADIFCFAQDQLARLKSAGALQEITDANLKAAVKAENDDVSYSAACVGDALVAYPLTSDNGYFMYYDKSVLTNAEDLTDMTKLIAACKAAGKKIYFQLEGSAWYNAAFFFAYGCESTWTTNTQGQFTEYVDTYNSAEGIKACKAMYELMSESNVYVDGSDAAEAFSSGAAVCISGTWDSNAVKTALGANMGCAELPSIKVGSDPAKHLGSFTGCKLLGVKPQTDAKKGAYVQSLARVISGKGAQLERYQSNGWGPSNKEAQADPAVVADVALTALRSQNQYATMQGQYPGDWWTSAKAIASSVRTSDGSDKAIKAILNTYEATIDSYING